MSIDISKIKPHKGASMKIEEKAEVAFDGNLAHVCLAGVLINIDKALEFRGELSGTVMTQCSRCLEEVNIPYETQLVQRICSKAVEPMVELTDEFSAGEEMDDVLFFEGNEVDFKPFIKGILRADLPIAVLCAEDCKGLCQVCGGDLNKKDCGCQMEKINPAFDELKILFDRNKEV